MNNREIVYETLNDHLEKKGNSINLNDELELQNDLGLSSLEMMTIIYLIEEKSKRKVVFSKLAGVKTVGQFCGVFEEI